MKYVIEIEDEPFVRKSCLYGEEAFYRSNTGHYFKKSEIERMSPYTKMENLFFSEDYQRGFENGLKLSRNLACMNYNELEEANIVQNWWEGDFDNFRIVAEKYRRWKSRKEKNIEDEDKNKFCIGDEVKFKSGSGGRFVIYNISSDGNLYGSGISGEGRKTSWSELNPDYVFKTGRHFDEVEEMLEKLNE